MITVAKVRSSIPRGFTRFYVLHLISEKPMTGKEMMMEAERQSEGEWSPSPGLIYPLLGRLLKDELIEETLEGRFTITAEGIEALSEHAKLQDQLEKQFNLVQKLGLSMFTTGKLLAEESIDRITNLTGIVKDRVYEGSEEIQSRFNIRYKQFLLLELEKMKNGEREVPPKDTTKEPQE